MVESGVGYRRSKGVSVRSGFRVGRRLIVWVLLIGLSAAFVYPFFWMVSTSLKTQFALSLVPPQVIPSPVAWSNYVEVVRDSPFWSWLENTAIITASQVVIGTTVSFFVAYGFARFAFPGRRVIFIVLLGTLMIPTHVTIVPLFLMFRNWGWLDTLLPFVVPPFLGGTAFSTGAFSIFVLRQFLMSLPRDLDEAAQLDGASSLGILFRILAPNCKPALGTVAVLAFIAGWNEFFGPYIILTTPTHLTLSVGMQFYHTSTATDLNLLMSMAVLNVLPIIVVFFFTQKYFIRGVALTGVRG